MSAAAAIQEQDLRWRRQDWPQWPNPTGWHGDGIDAMSLRALYAGPTAQKAQAHAVLYSKGECTKRPPEALCNAPHPSTA